VTGSRFRVGCTGWGYDDWREAGFYPPGTSASEYLERYARVFDVAEVDSSYYAAPSPAQTRRWAESTPSGFTFTVKFPGDITHKARLRDVADPLNTFLTGIEPLRQAGKLGPLLLQLPPGFSRNADGPHLEAFLEQVPDQYRLAVELRHPSWFVPETYRTLERRGAALVWSINQYAPTPPMVTADFVYSRFIGDRALDKFSHVQRDQTPEMREWRERFLSEARAAKAIYILLNNHYMGFAPATAQAMQRILELPEADLTAAARDRKQRSLIDFG